MDYRIGQTLADRKRLPKTSFTVLKVKDRCYLNGEVAVRVKGILVTGINGCGTHLREMDARSLGKMFPYVIFNPECDPEDIYPERK